MFCSIVYALIMFSLNFFSHEALTNKIKSSQITVVNLQNTINKTWDSLQSLNAQLQFENVLTNVSSNQYDMSNFKNFIASFNTLIFSNSSVNQVVYSLDDKSNTLTATISVNGNYTDMRNLIYYVETHFYFINVKDVSLYSSEGNIKGSVVMDIYFRDGTS